MSSRNAGMSRHDAAWYAAAALLAVGGVLAAQGLGYRTALALLAIVALLSAGGLLFFRRPEYSLYLIFILVSFGNEYSQTEWGVRSADQLATIYNRRLLPGVIASIFDLIFAAVVALWLLRKWLRRERIAGMPRRLWVPALLALAFTFYATILGLSRLPQGYELYHIMRELRPFAYGLAMLVMTVDIVTTQGKVDALWWLVVAVAAARGVQGVIRHQLGLGRWYYGATMVYYDYSDTILMLAGMAFLFVWLIGRPRLDFKTIALVGLSTAPMAYTFFFSYRRSFWIGAAVSLALLFVYANRRERQSYLALAGVAGIVLVTVALTTGQFELVGQRLLSVTDVQGDPSNFFRVLDHRNALNAIYESGGVGMGFGSRYRVIASTYWLAEFLGHVSRASHNGYLYVAMKMGLPGLLSWTACWLVILSFCADLWHRRTGRLRHIGLGISVVLIACAIGNTFLPLYYNLRPLLLLAVFSGLAISAWKLERAVPEAQDADRH